jgi:oligopeptide transport system ATP-binding protein
MQNKEKRRVFLSLRDVCVKFNVRGRILTAIRNVSLDIYENESIAIVGESGSGKTVLTKTFAGMLDSNGFISQGSIIFSDEELSKQELKLTRYHHYMIKKVNSMLNRYSVYERGGALHQKLKAHDADVLRKQTLSNEEENRFKEEMIELGDKIVELTNYIQTLDRSSERDAKEYSECHEKIRTLEKQQKTVAMNRDKMIAERKVIYAADKEGKRRDAEYRIQLQKAWKEAVAKADQNSNELGLSDETLERNKILAYEVALSIGRYPLSSQLRFYFTLKKAFKEAMLEGRDLSDMEVRKEIFQKVTFHVQFSSFDEEKGILFGYAIVDCAQIRYTKDWQKIRGRRIATVFQDPMTSLNPVLTIGDQIVTVILKHQRCSREEAKKRTLDIMEKVGIPEPEKRFDDYPFQYSGGMRQRIVIAIALSCQPKILICDEPTTALDVTIQAQIIRLIKDLQKELGFTTVYITHDLGVVANVAERVAVLYAGQIVELGTVEDIFYDPKHPYTWALLSSLPQLTEKGTELFSIPGTPPSLYNKIVGDAFAPRNKYAMAIDLVEEPPMMKVSETHYAKTWLLDERAPKTEAPHNIQNLHEKMCRIYTDLGE